MDLRRKNVRFRLTLWYTVTLMVILLLYAGITLMMMWFNLRSSLDHHLVKDYEVIEEMVRTTPDGHVLLDEDDRAFLEERWVEIRTPGGALLFNSRPFSSRDLPSWQPDSTLGGITFRSVTTRSGIRLRSLTTRTNLEGTPLVIRLYRSEEVLYAEMKKYLLLLLIALPLALMLAAGGGYWLAGRLLAPLDKMTATARQISEHNLHERLPVENPTDELGRLATTLNELLDRIQEAFERLRQFTYDAAHELRTPLTAIRSTGEVALQNPHDPDTYREIIGSILEENNRLTHLVNGLLLLSRADTGTFRLKKETLDLASYIAQTIELIQPLAEERGQRILFHAEGKPLLLLDPTLFRQALLNLLDNAIKYAPAGSTIRVILTRRHDGISISVTDEGTPIPAEYADKIFERFFRLDQSRSQASGGSGLGLAIARWAVEVQDGILLLTPGREQGNTFTILFNVSPQERTS